MCLVFVFPLMARLSEVVILSAKTGFALSFCLLLRWGVLHRVLLMVGWCQVLYWSRFLCLSSYCLILPKVRSLVVYSWSQCPLSKGSGLDLWSGTKIPQVVCYGKNEIKTNSHEWETKDKPQTNGSYKIRQIIIKIM